jgi:hypothetical protein
LQKYTDENVLYYYKYINVAYELPWSKVKFADESHFVGRQLFGRRMVSPIGERAYVVTDSHLNTTTTLTLLTSAVHENPVFLRYIY